MYLVTLFIFSHLIETIIEELFPYRGDLICICFPFPVDSCLAVLGHYNKKVILKTLLTLDGRNRQLFYCIGDTLHFSRLIETIIEDLFH